MSIKVSGNTWLRSLVLGTAMLVSLHCTNAFCAYITMATDFTITETGEGPTIEVMVENRGDVPAHDVQFEIIVEDRVFVGPVVNLLKVREKTSVKYSLADVIGLPGRYPVIIRTYYKDANGYRFTALSVGFYDYKSTTMPAVSISGHATRLPVDGKGQLEFLLRNDGQTGQKIDLVLLLPNELSATKERSTIDIGPQQEETLVYHLENYSALANSRYPVSLVGRYEDAGSLFSVAGSAIVQVAGNIKSTDRPIWVWILLGGLLPVVIAFLRPRSQKTLAKEDV